MGRSNLGNTTILTYPLDGLDIASPPTNLFPKTALPFMFSRISNNQKAIGAAPTTLEEIVHVANNAGTISGFHALVVVPGSAASITVDCKKNGTSILSAPITLTNATAASTLVNATVSVPSFAAGDVFSIAVTMSTNTGMSGLAAVLNGVEQGQPS